MTRSWQSYLINTALRLTAKRRFPAENGLANMRKRFANIDARLSKLPAELRVEKIRMGPVPGERLSTGESRNERVLFYVHGGGFAMGILGAHREMLAAWCSAIGATAYLPDYRLAPEHPYPAAPEDCLAAYRWLLRQGVAPGDVVVAGDSAGGCLSLVLLQRARDAGLPMPAAAVLLSPAADLTMSGDSVAHFERKDPMFHWQTLLLMRNAYASGPSMAEPGASPLFGDFAGLPPLKILVGSTEMLRSDAERVAARAEAAGVSVELDVWNGMPHVFPAIRALPESDAALSDIQDWLSRVGVWTDSPHRERREARAAVGS